MEPRKTCSSCGNSRTLIAFYRNRHCKDGYESRCKPCYTADKMKAAGTNLVSEKTCSSCKNVLPVSLFYKATQSRDSFGNYCKDCVREKNRHYRESNPKVKIKNRLAARIQYLSTDPNVRRKKSRDYYHKNKQRIAIMRKEKRANEAVQGLQKEP